MTPRMTMIPATIPMTRNRFNLIPPFETYYKLRATVFQVVYGCKYQERQDYPLFHISNNSPCLQKKVPVIILMTPIIT